MLDKQFCHGNGDSVRISPDGFHMYSWEFVIFGSKGGQYHYRMIPQRDKPQCCKICGFIFNGKFKLSSRNQATRKAFPEWDWAVQRMLRQKQDTEWVMKYDYMARKDR